MKESNSYYRALWSECKKIWKDRKIESFFIDNGLMKLSFEICGKLLIVRHISDLHTFFSDLHSFFSDLHSFFSDAKFKILYKYFDCLDSLFHIHVVLYYWHVVLYYWHVVLYYWKVCLLSYMFVISLYRYKSSKFVLFEETLFPCYHFFWLIHHEL